MTIQLNDPGLWQTQAHINGKWVASDSGKTFGVIDPANGEHLADVPDMGAAETAVQLIPPMQPFLRGGPKPQRNAQAFFANGLICVWPPRTTLPF